MMISSISVKRSIRHTKKKKKKKKKEVFKHKHLNHFIHSESGRSVETFQYRPSSVKMAKL